MSDNMTMETVDMPTAPEMTEVVVYNRDTVENVLKILDTQTPVVGIETMRKVVEVFDILKHEGSVQQAAVNREGNESEFVDPGFVPDLGPTFAGEGDVMYDADEEAVDADEPCDAEEPRSYNYVPPVVDAEADEIREAEE